MWVRPDLVRRKGDADGGQVLTEVRNAPKTLRRAAPIAISAVTVLYVLANISYVSWPTSIAFDGTFPDRPSLLP
jgi:hypothetical protein